MNSTLVRSIIVRQKLAAKVKNEFPEINVVTCSVILYIWNLFVTNWRGDLLYTPTPHPIPGINNQFIVLHDSYPFKVGRLSLFKIFLFRFSLFLSKCKVGFINCNDSKLFLIKLGVPISRMIFAPNYFPKSVPLKSIFKRHDKLTVVGLIGTDSLKKSYDELFNAVRKYNLTTHLVFYVYGHLNPYFLDLCSRFPELKIELIPSDNNSLIDFINRVDVMASIAKLEGFGRPIAFALQAGLRVELLDSPVFREFFSGGANFHVDVDSLVASLVKNSEKINLPFIPPAKIVMAFHAANKKIRQFASNIY